MPAQDPTPPDPKEVRAALELLARADFRDIQQAGYHLQVKDLYSPLNDCAFLEANRDLWAEPTEPAGIDWNLDHQLEVAREVAGYVEELREIPQESTDPNVFCWNNKFWNKADALVQYGLIRSRRPRRVVEVGCGWSSLMLSHALTKNEAEGVARTAVVQIEPNPRETLMGSLPWHWRQHLSILQRAPMSFFEELEANDVLFYDGSHCAKVASDVTWFFFRVLPRLKPGVLIHVHDIFFPHDYREDWVFDRGQTWNEQYVLQAFLMHNDCYRVEICNSYLAFKQAAKLSELYRDVQSPRGVSIWLRKIA